MVPGEVTRVRVTDKDQINHLVRKIGAAAGKVVILEVPDPVPILDSAANVRLLLFYAEREGKALYGESPHPAVQEKLAKAGLQPYSSQVDEPVVRSSGHREKERAFRPRWYHLAAIPVVIAVAAVLALYTPESARVVLVPEESEFRLTIQAPTEDLLTEPVSTEFIVADELEASGRKTEGVSRAQGRVVLVNDADKDITVPKGTSVTTAGKLAFEITEDITVPGRTTEYFHDIPVGVKAGQTEVAVRAVQLGSSGNVAAGRIVRIAGFPDLKVINPEAFFGGEDRSLSVVTEKDVTALTARLRQRGSEKVLPELKMAAGSGVQVLPTNVSWELTELQIAPKAGESASAVQGKGRIAASGETISLAWLQEYLTKRVNAELQSTDKNLLGDIQWGTLTFLEQGDFTCEIRGTSVSELPLIGLAEKVAGLAVTEAIETLRSLPGVQDVQIDAGDRERLPSREKRISFRVVPGGAVPTSGL